jgi:hypothetical protein
MNASLDSSGDWGDGIIGVLYSSGTSSDIIASNGMEWTPLAGRVQFGQISDLCERNINVQRNKTLGTDLGRMPVMPRRDVEQDTFLDNEIGMAMHSAKAKFGKAPFIEAYKRVLDTSKKIDDRRKASLEEETRLRGILRAGED